MGQEMFLTWCVKYNKAIFPALYIIVFYCYFTKFSFNTMATMFLTLGQDV
jgi:hypothetical protein